ncbi:hypothetical protein ACU4GH_28255 [Bradyrhizobium betae]
MPSSSFVKTACPHDCPSACALEVERLSSTKIGRVRGSAGNSYTSGICCTKVSRYAERVHHPDRLAQPMRRVGPKGSGNLRRSAGPMRSTRSPTGSPARPRPMGRKPSGPIIPAAIWA